MLTGIIALLIGIIIGVMIGIVRAGSELIIGTLRVVKSDDEHQPYLFLELDKPLSEFDSKERVLVNLKKEDYISHE